MKRYDVHCLDMRKTLTFSEKFLMDLPDMPRCVKDVIQTLEVGQSFTAHFTDLSFRFTRSA